MNLLVVSIAFPPKADPECIQTGRFYKALKGKSEFNIQVLTSKSPTLFMDIDNSLRQYLTENDDIVEIPIYETKISNFLFRKLRLGGVDWPDSKFTFHLQWRRALKRLTRPDIIYSRSFPLSSTIMAYRLAEYFKVPWVLHLSDPWSISPLHKRSRLNQRFNDRWERKCFERANAICFTSEGILTAYSQRYDHLKHKFQVIPNVPYEHVRFIDLTSRSVLRIAYTGGLAGLRRPDFLLLALESLIERRPEIENKIEVILAGNMDRAVSKMLANTKLRCVKHVGNISLDKSIELQQNSDVLLSIDNPITTADQAMFIPSKIYDYINSRRRILALTTRDSSTAKFLQDFKSDVVDFDDVAGIQLRIEEYLTKFSKKEDSYFKQEDSLPIEIGIKHNIEKLSGLLHKAIKEND